MIAGTYIISGVLLLLTAFLLHQGMLSAVTMTACWCAVLFFASAGASSAYLTVSEVFPMQTRALAIAFFYAIGTAVGGITGPLLFSKLVSTGKSPGGPLVEAARTADAELVVLSTRGEGGVSRLLGAVSQYVLRSSGRGRCPCTALRYD